MSYDEYGQIGASVANLRHDRIEVVEKFIEAANVTAGAVGATVTLLIVGVNGALLRCQVRGYVFVSAAVFGIAVNEDDRSLGIRREPRTAKQSKSTGTLDVELGSSDTGRSTRLQDSASPRTAALAFLTRSRYTTPRIFEPQK